MYYLFIVYLIIIVFVNDYLKFLRGRVLAMRARKKEKEKKKLVFNQLLYSVFFFLKFQHYAINRKSNLSVGIRNLAL